VTAIATATALTLAGSGRGTRRAAEPHRTERYVRGRAGMEVGSACDLIGRSLGAAEVHRVPIGPSQVRSASRRRFRDSATSLARALVAIRFDGRVKCLLEQ